MTSSPAPTRTDAQPGHPDTRTGDIPRWRLVLVLGSLSLAGPLSVDTYLPALPAIQRDLATSPSLVQLTLSACLLGLALGQLVAGPLSDAYGRRRPALVGMVGFTVATALCAVAPTAETLILCRFVQGLFGSAGMVIPRAVVRDRFSGIRAAQMFSLLMLVIGAGPILAPTLGGAILLVTDWRGVFGVLVGLGLVLVAVAWRALPESNPPANRSPASLRTTLRAFGSLIRDRAFAGYAVMIGMSMGTMFAYIAGSSFILQNHYGVSEQRYAVLFAVIAAGYIGMSQVNVRLVTHYRLRSLLRVGVAVNLAGAIAILLIATVADPGLAGFVAALCIVALSNGLINPNVTALALQDQPRVAGAASALLGVMSFAVGAIVAPLVGIAGEDTAVPLGIILVGLSLTGLTAFAVLTGRRARSPME